MSKEVKTAAEARHQEILAMTEAELYDAIEPMAHLYSWQAAHFRPAMTDKGWRTPVQGDGAGFPDIVLARRGTTLFRELKRTGEQPTPKQQAWLEAVGGCIWRPADLESGEIERQLR